MAALARGRLRWLILRHRPAFSPEGRDAVVSDGPQPRLKLAKVPPRGSALFQIGCPLHSVPHREQLCALDANPSRRTS